MILKVIAYARNGHTDKFGIPRQSREKSPIVTRIVFEPEYSVAEAFRGIEGYSHLWLIWGFSENRAQNTDRFTDRAQTDHDWSPTVRPPRLGGNKRMGVFATRSPFRPNPIGLTSVRLLGVRRNEKLIINDCELSPANSKGNRLELLVSGADLMDGTPIYDIKPYLSFSDSHEDARNGFADEMKDYRLEVVWEAELPVLTSLKPDDLSKTDREWVEEAEYILSQDPRPAYQDDPTREYKLDYRGYTVTFVVEGERVVVKKIQKM